MAFALDDLAAAPLLVPYPLAASQKIVLLDEVAKICGGLGGLRTFVPFVVDALGCWFFFALGRGRANALARAGEAAVDLVAGLIEVGGEFV